MFLNKSEISTCTVISSYAVNIPVSEVIDIALTLQALQCGSISSIISQMSKEGDYDLNSATYIPGNCLPHYYIFISLFVK